ncbi:hypothetical protein QBC43DRAFT_286926 [Cladorrhinum sp. PSN259]|nr:hypothetical protein QBC43DRAFT_286926 [Cladorrhinum sp. PSN259]
MKASPKSTSVAIGSMLSINIIMRRMLNTIVATRRIGIRRMLLQFWMALSHRAWSRYVAGDALIGVKATIEADKSLWKIYDISFDFMEPSKKCAVKGWNLRGREVVGMNRAQADITGEANLYSLGLAQASGVGMMMNMNLALFVVWVQGLTSLFLLYFRVFSLVLWSLKNTIL